MTRAQTYYFQIIENSNGTNPALTRVSSSNFFVTKLLEIRTLILNFISNFLEICAFIGMLLIPGTGNGERGTGNGEPGTGVWEQVYSGNPLENSKWRSKQKKGSKRNDLGKGEFPPAVPPDGQYVIVRAESD